MPHVAHLRRPFASKVLEIDVDRRISFISRKCCPSSQNNTATSLPAESSHRTNPLPESVVLLFILCSNLRELPSMEQWYFILIPLFLAGSIFAFIAYGIAHRLESLLKSFPPNDLAFRLHQLEQKLAELQKIVNASSPSSPSTSPSPAPPPPTAPSPQAPPPPWPAPEAVRPPSVPARRDTPGPALQPWPNLPPQPPHADLEALIGGRWFNRI